MISRDERFAPVPEAITASFQTDEPVDVVDVIVPQPRKKITAS